MTDTPVFDLRGKLVSQADAELIQEKRNAILRGEIANVPPTRTLQAAPRTPKTVTVPGELITIGHEEGEEISAEEAHKEANLKILRQARHLIENNQLEGVIIIGRQKGGAHFLTDHALDRKIVSHNDLFAYVGVLDTLKRELGDITTLAPQMLPDGSIADPHGQLEGEEAFQ